MQRTDMNHTYYSAHSYGEEHFKMRMDYDTGSGCINLFAEKDSHLTDYRPGSPYILVIAWSIIRLLIRK